jgi:lipid A 4'-phosphatase
VLRMAGGAHFFSDVVFAGVFMFLVVWTLHGLIYRWRPTRLTDEAAERPLQRAGNWLRAALARLTGRKSQSP